MKLVWSRFMVACALLSSLAMASDEPVIKQPSVDALRAVQLPDSAEVAVCAFGNNGKYAFAIFECKAGSRVCYLFSSDEIKDFLCLSSKREGDELKGMSRSDVLKFFSVRFRGIANDLSHQKWRPDVIDAASGPLQPLDEDSAKGLVLFALIYDGYASAIEEALAVAEKRSRSRLSD